MALLEHKSWFCTARSSRWGQQSLSAQTAHFSLFCTCPIKYQAMFVFEFCRVVYGHSSLKFVIWWAVFKLMSNSVLALTKSMAKNILGFNMNSCPTLFMYSLRSKHCVLWYYHEETTHIKWVQM